MTEADAFDASTEDPPPGHDAADNVTALLNNVTDAVATDEMMGPRYHKRVRIVIIVTMIILSVVGNSVVCCNLLVQQRRRRVSKARVLFLNLAIADLLVACITMMSQVVWEVMGRLWIAGDAFCRFFKFLQTFALVSSTYMLVAIAIDRYIAIATPLAPSTDPWKLAALTWLTSCMPSLPNVYVFHSVEVAPGKCFCASIFYDPDTPLYHRQIYMGFVFFTVFVVPLVLLIAFHAGILWAIWKHTAINRHMGRQTTSSLPRAKVKTLKMTAVVFGAFLVTNVPYMVQEAILAFGNPGILDANLVALFGVISASNSAINPYIFLYFQRPHGDIENGGGFWRTAACMVRDSLTCRLLTRSRAGSQMSTDPEDNCPPMRQSKMSVARTGNRAATDTPPNMKSRATC
ncbi:gonadotropin-releasing hormone receptor-like [Dermacentor andersoni]|uniref:gonadotropin-releasing hormone receptor-like n=1 Tax=Dermacentor andersoni TaxID=34620 RepID=UPI002155E4B8|nr:oxytocin receptor-like [Dermacentor andersoni]XP_054932588.1 oxytocin receptor-like [Dermacentor andersoni]XP_054932589.1 oxytocin receptor-like [Dermacentor andersoni]